VESIILQKLHIDHDIEINIVFIRSILISCKTSGDHRKHTVINRQ